MRLSTTFALLASLTSTHAVRYQCDPCLDRSTYSLKSFFHGSSNDQFWEQVRSGAMQSAMDTNIDFTMTVTNGPDLLAEHIRDVAADWENTDALVISIPNEEVAAAAKEAVAAGVPVFGLGGGSSLAKDAGVLDFVGPDNYESGVMAAQQFQSILNGTALSSIVFVSDGGDEVAHTERLRGMNHTIPGVSLKEISVDGLNPSSMATVLNEAFARCTYGAVMISGVRSLPYAITAYESAGCSASTAPMGVFGTSMIVYEAIGNDEISFAIDEQQTFQGALATHIAAIYASTGKSLARPANGAYLTGPKLVTKDSLPTDSQQVCELDGWPVCTDEMAPKEYSFECDCIERSKIKIGGVTHGHSTDSFWDPVYAASAQAALDLGVELINERPEPEKDLAQGDILHQKMANKIKDLCVNEGVDGLFVSIPSEIVLEAIQTCLDLDIPVMSINAGAGISREMGLMHHIGMIESNAGMGAGEFLVGRGIKKGFCINHAEGVNVVEERCKGFGEALEAAGIEYLGQVYVPDDSKAQYIDNVETAVEEWTGDRTGDWDGIGILAAGGPQHIPVIALQARHDKALIGAFDTSDELYDALDSGIKEFGIDQQPYLQGYMPVLLLTHFIATGQSLSNEVIESGPAFIEASPTDVQVTCEVNNFVTCPPKEVVAAPVYSSSSEGNLNTGLIVALIIVAVAMVLSVSFLTYRINKLNKHVGELKLQGKDVPDLSFSQRMSSMVKPVDNVVEEAMRMQ